MKTDKTEVNKEIISKLMEDPRASFTEIAKSIGVSPESVRQKVNRMTLEGKLKFYCMTDGRDLGKRRVTFIIKVPLANKISALEKLKSMPITLEIHAGVLTDVVVMDITTNDLDRDTHELLKTLGEMGAEVKEIFESELVYFNSTGVIR